MKTMVTTIFAATLFMVCMTSAHGKDDVHTKLSGFVAVGEALYKRATTIVDQNPTTDSDIVRIATMANNGAWMSGDFKHRSGHGEPE
jgi:hypothetical protein